MANAGPLHHQFDGQRVYIHDVAMRDGLQIEPIFVPTEQKIDMVNALSKTGLKKIEVTSFTSPKAIPALRMQRISCGRSTGIPRSPTLR